MVDPDSEAKAVVGLVLSLSFGHSLGLVHGHLTGYNAILNEDGVIQIADFCMNGLRERGGEYCGMVRFGGFSEASWSPMSDIRTSAEFLSEIVIRDFEIEGIQALDVPEFVIDVIEKGLPGDCFRGNSFAEILKILRENHFKIVTGVDSEEIFKVVNGMKLSEKSIR
jgi:serine/threonine protein kinase